MENPFLKGVLESLNTQYPSVTVTTDEYGMTNVFVEKQHIYAVVETLKQNNGFIFLTDICGAHYPHVTGAEFQVIYHMHNLVKNIRMRLKVNLNVDDLTIPSMVPLFAGANWMERETFDFYGIIFEGHPDLRRILNMDDMDYHPMRKEYALEDETREDKNDSFFGR